jgi:hypothetical protein
MVEGRGLAHQMYVIGGEGDNLGLLVWCGLKGHVVHKYRGGQQVLLGGSPQWNRGRKLAIRSQQAEVIAFAGHVIFGLNFMVGLPDASMTDDGLQDRLSQLSADYPIEGLKGAVFIRARRVGQGMAARFVVTSHRYLKGKWNVTEHAVSSVQSEVVCSFGSGSNSARSEVNEWMAQAGNTSRSVFSGFCDSLRAKRDPYTGEPPQLACIYREFPARELGVVWNDQLYFGGLTPPPDLDISTVEWRNDLFERCDPHTRLRLPDAQRQARPREKPCPVN